MGPLGAKGAKWERGQERREGGTQMVDADAQTVFMKSLKSPQINVEHVMKHQARTHK